MLSRRLIVSVVLSTAARGVQGQETTQRPPTTATSSWRITRDARGHEIRRELVNRTFAFATRELGARPADVLFVQEVRTVERPSAEGDSGRVHLEAWVNVRPDTGYHRRLWSTDLPGSAARLLPDYFEVTEFGCCGAFDTRTLISLGSGRSVVTLTSGPVELRGETSGEVMSLHSLRLGYLSSMGTQAVGHGRSDSLAFGELVLFEGDSVLSRIVLRATTPKGDPLANVGFAVRAGRDSVSEGTLLFERGAHPAAYVYSESWRPIVVPIAGKRLDVEHATIPYGVRAEASRP